VLWEKLELFIARIMDEEPFVGLSVGVAQAGEVIYAQGFGVADLETKRAVTPETIFGTASVTKSFTALAVMRLAEQGHLSLNDAVTKFLPAFRLQGADDVSAIKIRHLLSHTSGLPPMRRRQDLITFAQHIDFLANEPMPMLGAPGEYISYSNDAFLVLGALIEAISGSTYLDHMSESVLRPLGMTRSTMDVTALESFTDISTPYVHHRSTDQFEAQKWPVLNNYVVGGGVRSCVHDLLTYGGVYTGQENLATAETLRAMYTTGLPVSRNSYYGFGWRFTPDHAGLTLVEHGGGQPGVSSHFGFVPEKRLCVAVLANVTGVSAARIWLAAVNAAMGLPLDYNTNDEKLQDFVGDWQAYTGAYASAEGGHLKVFCDEGSLHLAAEGLEHKLTYCGNHTFFYNYRGQRTVRFHLKGTSPAWAAFSGLRMLVKQ